MSVSSKQHNPWRFCVAPMMDWTTRECRGFHRLLSRQARLYTEMLTSGAVIHGDRTHLLDFAAAEHPVALQLGGSDPADLALAARIGAEHGYDEINLNCGCPSDRVQNGRFGACLMAEPERVAEAVAAMRAVVDIPVTVKCRLGIDDLDSDAHLHHFVATIAAAGCTVFIVHARKAWLNGLSPKDNREIPPLQYPRVHALKQAFPDLTIVLNGGLQTLDAVQAEMRAAPIDGVMLGRAAYQDPWLLSRVDSTLFGCADPAPSRESLQPALLQQLAALESRQQPARRLLRHILGLYNGQPGAKSWRRRLSQPIAPGHGATTLLDAWSQVAITQTQYHETAALSLAS